MVSTTALKTRNERLERELSRIRTSPSLRLGAHITKAIRKPWLAIFLPITLPLLMLQIGLELLGKRAPPQIAHSITNAGPPPRKDVVMMFPTNGVGFGHFTRLLAIARRMKALDKNLEVVFFTTMPTLHLLIPEGIPVHHISGAKSFKNMGGDQWNALLEDELTLALDTHRPGMFMFDGAFPYRGMLRAINGQKMRKVWLRRGTFRKGSSVPVDSIEHFDLIVHPEDSVAINQGDLEHGVEAITCAPITMVGDDELLDRAAARRRLGVSQDAIVAYVQLGAGKINDIDSEVRLTVEALKAHAGIEVVLGESLIGDRVQIEVEGIRLLRDFPNAQYFNAFDFTVIAGGYNSFHEVVRFGLPTIFYPNLETGMDDQLARVREIEDGENKVIVVERNEVEITAAIDGMVSRAENGSLNRSRIESPNGADELAVNLLNILGGLLDNWTLPNEAFALIQEKIPKGSIILELGSGAGTGILAEDYDVVSVEHDEEWLGIHSSRYIHATIVPNPTSERFVQKGWYDSNTLSVQLPEDYDLLLIDGPTGDIGRAGILEHLSLFRADRPILLDDTDRPGEYALLQELVAALGLSVQIIQSESLRLNGTPRSFAWIDNNEIDVTNG